LENSMIPISTKKLFFLYIRYYDSCIYLFSWAKISNLIFFWWPTKQVFAKLRSTRYEALQLLQTTSAS